MSLLAHGTDLAALLVVVSFAAGLNVYATVATLGLLARAEVIALPPDLQLVSSWYVIGISVALFLLQFFADKIPAFDLIWNALHTFVRIPVAGFVGSGGGAHGARRRQNLGPLGAGPLVLL